jgi:hypothetical protein
MSTTSKKNWELLNYLKQVIDNYMDSKKDYKETTEEIYLVYRALELPGSYLMKSIEDLWGTLKLIEANAKYDKLDKLIPPDKGFFETILCSLRKLVEGFLLENPPEPEDSLTWPFEEYK